MIYDMRLFYARLFSVLHCSILCHLCHELGFWYRAWSLDALKTLEFGFWLEARACVQHLSKSWSAVRCSGLARLMIDDSKARPRLAAHAADMRRHAATSLT